MGGGGEGVNKENKQPTHLNNIRLNSVSKSQVAYDANYLVDSKGGADRVSDD